MEIRFRQNNPSNKTLSQQPLQIAFKKLEFQMKNNPLGNSGTFQDAHVFRRVMDNTFEQAIPDSNKLKNSIMSGNAIQQICLNQMKNGEPISVDSNHFNQPPKHLHLSYFGTKDHSVDIIITKNDKGMFITVCNRGYRGAFENQHDIFETFPIYQELNHLLNDLHAIEKNNGTIEDFYSRCGKKLSIEKLKENGFKSPPETKNQKAGNCVRTSISAAQKWLANEHDCMQAHKLVKPTILSNTLETLLGRTNTYNHKSPPNLSNRISNERSASSTINTVPQNSAIQSPVTPREILSQVHETLTLQKPNPDFANEVLNLINDICFLSEMSFITENKMILTDILNEIRQKQQIEQQRQLKEFHDAIIKAIQDQLKVD